MKTYEKINVLSLEEIEKIKKGEENLKNHLTNTHLSDIILNVASGCSAVW